MRVGRHGAKRTVGRAGRPGPCGARRGCRRRHTWGARPAEQDARAQLAASMRKQWTQPHHTAARVLGVVVLDNVHRFGGRAEHHAPVQPATGSKRASRLGLGHHPASLTRRTARAAQSASGSSPASPRPGPLAGRSCHPETVTRGGKRPSQNGGKRARAPRTPGGCGRGRAAGTPLGTRWAAAAVSAALAAATPGRAASRRIRPQPRSAGPPRATGCAGPSPRTTTTAARTAPARPHRPRGRQTPEGVVSRGEAEGNGRRPRTSLVSEMVHTGVSGASAGGDGRRIQRTRPNSGIGGNRLGTNGTHATNGWFGTCVRLVRWRPGGFDP